MSDGTKIEWADATVNAVNGCTRVSPGCGGPGDVGGCYAERLAATRLRDHPSRLGLAKMTSKGPRWTGEVSLHEPALLQPLAWKRPRRIFWNAHGDLFHEKVPDAWIDRVFAVCALTPQHTHMILTKRPERMRGYATDVRTPGRIARVIIDMLIAKTIKLREPWPVQTIGPIDEPNDITVAWPLQNVWKGTSVEDQQRADERVPHLLATPAAVRFLSCEPLLGPADLARIHETFDDGLGHSWESCLNGMRFDIWSDGSTNGHPKVDWVIVGGESGPNARPMHPDWVRSLRDQCADTGVPFHFKQWGEWAPGENCGGPMTRTQETAEWFDGKWTFGQMTPCESEGLHRDDEPTLYRCGKRTAGRLLDGVDHSQVPHA